MTHQNALNFYDALGLDTLPLAPGGKNAIRQRWQERDSLRLWQNAPQGANIGIRAGGVAHVAFIDCDDKNAPGTFETVANYLTGLGVSHYPIVETASGVGRHIYITFGGGLNGDARNLAAEVGAGEFRFGPGAYVVAPPSTITGGSEYRLLSGNLHNMPALALGDILPILGSQDTTPARKNIPRPAMALLHGKNAEGYPSRSEAEQALILSLVNAGFECAEVLDLFNRHPCAGKYAELKADNPRNAERWLNHSYRQAVEFAKNESPARRTISAAFAWADSAPWPGRTGAVDRAIFTAHLSIAHKAGRLNWAASCRNLAELAGVSSKTATNANKRLFDADLIALEESATVESANIFRLAMQLDKLTHSLNTPCEEVCKFVHSHDLFRQNAGLGKRAAQVWQVLQDGPATVDELTQATGTHAKTIKRALSRMAAIVDSHTGECLPMVASGDGGKTWHALPADLDNLALVVGSAGLGKKQRERHAQERRNHKRQLARGAKG
jgi:hypothetical protein